MTDIECRYLGMRLRSPIVASASPMTGRLQNLLALQEAGVGAVVLPSLFEEEIDADSTLLDDHLNAGTESVSEASSYLPSTGLSFAGPAAHVKLVGAARSSLDIPVIASINGVTDGGWLGYAAMLVDAGADALELNLYAVESDSTRTASDVETEYLRLIEHLRWRVSVPLAVKLSPFFSSTANFAKRLVDLGVDGLVLFNRFVQPDIDVETFDVSSKLELSHRAELRLPLRWVGLLRPMFPGLSIALTSGVQTGVDVVKSILAGADVTMIASELLRHGPAKVREIEAELVGWMAAHEYTSVGQMCGSVSEHAARDANAYERAQYIRTLTGFRPAAVG